MSGGTNQSRNGLRDEYRTMMRAEENMTRLGMDPCFVQAQPWKVRRQYLRSVLFPDTEANNGND